MLFTLEFLGVAFAHISKDLHHKFSIERKKVCYNDHCKAYCLWDPKANKIIENKHVIFNEDIVRDFDHVNSYNCDIY
jgi:hypothetical protein